MAQNEPIRCTSPASEIPDKLYFRIGEVAKLCAVPAYVLRFWETEFPQLKPNKGGTGQRLYRRRDVETALRIKRLLKDEGYTIPGARQIIKIEQRGGGKVEPQISRTEPQLALAIDPPAAVQVMQTSEAPPLGQAIKLQRLRQDLQELHTFLSRPVAGAGSARVQSIRAPRQPRPIGHTLRLEQPSCQPLMENLFDPQPKLVPDSPRRE